jgi:hypothetical protein
LRVLPSGYSALSPAFSVVASTRASARIGSASVSELNPLAMVTSLPERSDFGNGFAPQQGCPPCLLGSIQIWKIRVVPGSRLYSEWRTPEPALITWTSPASVRPLLPRLS